MERYTSIRDSLLAVLKEEMTGPSFEAWAKYIEIYKLDDVLSIAYLAVPEIPGKNILQIVSILDNRYKILLQDSLAKVLGSTYRVVIKPLPDYADADKEEASKEAKSETCEQEDSTNLMPQYTFDSFVVGESNRFAHAAALAVADSPADAYNPLYIYAAPGLGKTHLLHAIGNHLCKARAELKIMYVSSETFTNELIMAIQKNETYKFKQKYRSIDVLLIDDIQFFGKTVAAQEEFFHTFNSLYQSKKQIVISSDCEPEKLNNLEERLRSRFAWNMVADIQAPDFETRVAILMKQAESKGLEITPEIYEVISLIATKVKNNVRELEGAFTRIVNYSRLMKEEITVDFAKRSLKNIFKEKERKVTPQNIKKAVCKFYGTNEADLDSSKRQKEIAEARQVAMYLIRELTDLSLPKIGEAFGGKHHTTVLHACKHVEDLIKNDADKKEMIEEIKEGISG